MEEHRADHCPFRSCCEFCIMGRGVGQQHTASPSESTVAIVGLDNFFITSEGIQRRLELAMEADDESVLEEDRRKGTVIKRVLARCRETKCVFADIVPKKGADEEHYCLRQAGLGLRLLARPH